jgi:UDP-N-acetylmuramyl tripeptide synthase
MGARRAAAVTAGRVSGIASRIVGRGGGTALPGLVATALDRDIVRDLSRQLPCGSVAISGTNGKTTTSRLLAGILDLAGYHPVRNQSGSNLERGLASTLVQRANLLGRLSATDRAIGVFEVDEAALPEVLFRIGPNSLVLLDLFRDQLDRYGEVATVAAAWGRALEQLPRTTSLIANADDPLIAAVSEAFHGTVIYFGVESSERASAEPEHASDVKACPRCGGPIVYDRVFLGHFGHYSCSACSFTRPRPSIAALDVRLQGIGGSTFDVQLSGARANVSFALPGMYNVYNAVAAAATADVLGLEPHNIVTGLETGTAAFGRMERIQVEGHTVYIALAKNPAGLNEVLRTVADSESRAHLLVMLNDNIADGRDVSWIWDADVEILAGKVESVVFSGTRAEDMALRFKYGGASPDHVGDSWSIEHDPEKALERALSFTPPDVPLFIVPTYTAMIDIRKVLTDLGFVRPYWEE